MRKPADFQPTAPKPFVQTPALHAFCYGFDGAAGMKISGKRRWWQLAHAADLLALNFACAS